MKNISKKQKLIGFIAILLVTVIIAIVITTSIIRNNNQVASEGYSATTASAESSLISNYILNGITIGGITGKMDVLDTSDATATPCDIAKGKTAYVKGVKITGRYGTYESPLGTVTGNETNNTTVNDIYGNKVKVPAGFKIVNPNQNVPDGIIIEDIHAGDDNTKGSQFVWVPVGNVYYDSCENYETITLGRYDFKDNGDSICIQPAENWKDTSSKVGIDDYYELESSSYGNSTAKNLEDFITKTLSSGGYYIGRYEAGDTKATDSKRTNRTSDSNPIACKTGIYPYTYILQTKASSLCQGMYTSTNFESDLINSYTWDTIL